MNTALFLVTTVRSSGRSSPVEGDPQSGCLPAKRCDFGEEACALAPTTLRKFGSHSLRETELPDQALLDF
jgi:hypothetical protein